MKIDDTGKVDDLAGGLLAVAIKLESDDDKQFRKTLTREIVVLLTADRDDHDSLRFLVDQCRRVVRAYDNHAPDSEEPDASPRSDMNSSATTERTPSSTVTADEDDSQS